MSLQIALPSEAKSESDPENETAKPPEVQSVRMYCGIPDAEVSPTSTLKLSSGCAKRTESSPCRLRSAFCTIPGRDINN